MLGRRKRERSGAHLKGAAIVLGMPTITGFPKLCYGIRLLSSIRPEIELLCQEGFTVSQDVVDAVLRHADEL